MQKITEVKGAKNYNVIYKSYSWIYKFLKKNYWCSESWDNWNFIRFCKKIINIFFKICLLDVWTKLKFCKIMLKSKESCYLIEFYMLILIKRLFLSLIFLKIIKITKILWAQIWCENWKFLDHKFMFGSKNS